MGCCSSKQIEPVPLKSPQATENPDLNPLAPLLNELKLSSLKNDIDEAIIVIDKVSLNALAYSLVGGRLSNFIFLSDSMGASIAAMESMLERQGLIGLDILIEKGYCDFLRYYLPIYKSLFPQKFSSLEDSETSCSFPNARTTRKTPIHIATEKGHIEIIKILYEAFQDTYAPEKYSVHHIDEYSGENSALIACRKCDFMIVKYLREVCMVDFKIKSKRSESALHLAAFGSKSNKLEGFQVIKYLIETVEIDFTFQYEEVLLMVEDIHILEYIEEKLRSKGISCTKEEVEKKYSISSYKANRPMFMFYDDPEFTVGAISSIDANLTVSLMNASFFQDSDYN